MPFISCTVENTIPQGLRLDRYAADYLKILSRSQVKARRLEARLNGKAVKVSKLLNGGEYLELSWTEAESINLIPQNLPLEVVYEDKRVIVVNKAQGMVVHPGAGNRQGTLANALLFRKLENRASGDIGNNVCGSEIISGSDARFSFAQVEPQGYRPGIVHRLDKDTSGLIIAAWDDEALAFLSEQFKARKVLKTYAALVHGSPRETQGLIEKNIIRSRRDRKTFVVSDKEGRQSLTYYKLVKSWGFCSLLLVRPKTGRTHQIRVHLKYLGNPIIGDPLYGRDVQRFKKTSLMLHAKRLSIVIPEDKKFTTFRTRLPVRFREIIGALK